MRVQAHRTVYKAASPPGCHPFSSASKETTELRARKDRKLKEKSWTHRATTLPFVPGLNCGCRSPPVVRRRERRRHRAPVAPVAPAASTVRPGEPAQYWHSRGRADRPRQAPAPAPPRLQGGVHRPKEADWMWDEASRQRESLSPPRTRGRILPPPCMMLLL